MSLSTPNETEVRSSAPRVLGRLTFGQAVAIAVIAAIALWSRERVQRGAAPLPVYFIGVGEALEDLQTFDAREFAQALLN